MERKLQEHVAVSSVSNVGGEEGGRMRQKWSGDEARFLSHAVDVTATTARMMQMFKESQEIARSYEQQARLAHQEAIEARGIAQAMAQRTRTREEGDDDVLRTLANVREYYVAYKQATLRMLEARSKIKEEETKRFPNEGALMDMIEEARDQGTHAKDMLDITLLERHALQSALDRARNEFATLRVEKQSGEGGNERFGSRKAREERQAERYGIVEMKGGKGVLPGNMNAMFALRSKAQLRKQFVWPGWLTLENYYKQTKKQHDPVTVDDLKQAHAIVYAKAKKPPKQREVPIRMDYPTPEEMNIREGSALDMAHCVWTGGMTEEDFRTLCPEIDLRSMLRLLDHLDERGTSFEKQSGRFIFDWFRFGCCKATSNAIHEAVGEAVSAVKKNAAEWGQRIVHSRLGQVIAKISDFIKYAIHAVLAWYEGASRSLALHVMELVALVKDVVANPIELIQGLMASFGGSLSSADMEGVGASLKVSAQGNFGATLAGFWQWIISLASAVASFDAGSFMNSVKDFNVMVQAGKNIQWVFTQAGKLFEMVVDAFCRAIGRSPYYESAKLEELKKPLGFVRAVAAMERAHEQGEVAWQTEWPALERDMQSYNTKHDKDPSFAEAVRTNRTALSIGQRLYMKHVDRSMPTSRSEPVAVILVGPPGLGKSVSTTIIAKAMALHMGETDATSWVLGDDFQEAYGTGGCKSVVVIDDVFLQKDTKERAVEAAELTKLISTAAYIVPKAFETKGTSMFAGRLLLETTNLQNFRETGTTASSALIRRHHLVTIEPRVREGVGKLKLDDQDVDNNWTFTFTSRKTLYGAHPDLKKQVNMDADAVPHFHPNYEKCQSRNSDHKYKLSEFIHLLQELTSISTGQHEQNDRMAQKLFEKTKHKVEKAAPAIVEEPTFGDDFEEYSEWHTAVLDMEPHVRLAKAGALLKSKFCDVKGRLLIFEAFREDLRPILPLALRPIWNQRRHNFEEFVEYISKEWNEWAPYFAVLVADKQSSGTPADWFRRQWKEVQEGVDKLHTRADKVVAPAAQLIKEGKISEGVGKLVDTLSPDLAFADMDEAVGRKIGMSRWQQVKEWGYTIGWLVLGALIGAFVGYAIGMAINVTIAWFLGAEKQAYSAAELPIAKKVVPPAPLTVTALGKITEGMEGIVKKISKNVCEIMVDGPSPAWCTGTGIGPELILTTKHVFARKSPLVIRQWIGKAQVEKITRVLPEEYKIASAAEADWAVIVLKCSGVQAFETLTQFIPRAADLKHFHPEGLLLSRTKEGAIERTCTSAPLVARDGRIVTTDNEFLTSKAYLTQAATAAGQSGAPWIAVDDAQFPLIATHTANTHGTAVAQPIWRELIDEARMAAGVDPQCSRVPWLPVTTEAPEIFDRVQVVAEVPRNLSTPLDQRNKFRPSAISAGLEREGIRIQKVPSCVASTEHYKPLAAWLARAATVDNAPTFEFEPAVIKYLASQIKIRNTFEPHALAPISAMLSPNGRVHGVPTKRSVGYPTNALLHIETKEQYFADGGVRAAASLEKRHAEVKEGRPAQVALYSVAPKGELLDEAAHPEWATYPPAELRVLRARMVDGVPHGMKRARGFSPQDVEDLLWTYSVFYSLHHAVLADPVAGPCAASFEKESAAAVAALVNQASGYKFADDDSKTYDLREFQTQKRALRELGDYWYETFYPFRDDKERNYHRKCRNHWWQGNWQTFVVLGRFVVNLPNYFPSGTILTMVFQSLRQALMKYQALWITAITIISPRLTVREVFSDAYVKTVGDDALLGVKGILLQLKPRQVQETYEVIFEVETTCSDKDVHYLEEWKKFEEVFFLKCTPRKEGLQWRMALAKSSIESQLHWHRSRGDELELTRSQCESALRSAMHWGEEYYNRLLTSILRAAVSAHIDLVLPTYDEVVREYVER